MSEGDSVVEIPFRELEEYIKTRSPQLWRWGTFTPLSRVSPRVCEDEFK